MTHALPRSAVLADVIPGARVRDAVLVASGALLTALFAQIAIDVPPSPVPITGQTLAVGLVGATLGMRRGASSLTLYVLLGLFLPFYADGESGWDVVWGASGGYIDRVHLRRRLHRLDGRARGVPVGGPRLPGVRRRPAVIFAFGLAGLKISVGESWGWTIHNGFSIFIVGGLVKALIGAVALPSAWRLVRRFERDPRAPPPRSPATSPPSGWRASSSTR